MFFFSEAAESANKGTDPWSIVMMVAIVVLLIVVVVVLPMINNRKQRKQYNDLLEAVKLGATVKTIGGIIGKIVGLRTVDGERVFTLETGDENAKSTLEFDINAIYQVIDPMTYKPVVAEPVPKKAGKKEEAKVEEAPVEEAKPEDKE